jgi:hypothetical protein
VPGNPLNNGVKCAATRHGEHMDDKPHGIRRLCVAYGIDPPSGYGNHEKAAAERLGVTAFTEVCAALGLNRMLLDRHDSGQVGLLPVGIDEPMVVSSLIEALASALAGRSVRFRLAFHEGITILTADGFGGNAVAKVRRLAESLPLRAALTEHPAASLAAILSAPVFEDIAFEDSGPGLDAGQFRQVEVADPDRASCDIAWIFVPIPRPG